MHPINTSPEFDFEGAAHQLAVERSQPGRFIKRMQKIGEKMREISEPLPHIKEEQYLLLDHLRGLDIEMPYAFGSVPERSLVDNIKPHQQNESRVFYNVDLSDAFGNTQPHDLLRVLGRFVPSQFQAYIFDMVLDNCFDEKIRGLPQGAPASPLLFNISCLDMDEQLGEYCTENDIIYTRYVDDLTFSTKDGASLNSTHRRHLRKIIEERPGSIIAHHKSQLYSLDKGPITVTGVSLYPDGHIGPSPKILDNARVLFEEIIHNKPSQRKDKYFEDQLMPGWSDLKPELAVMYDDYVRAEGHRAVLKSIVGDDPKNMTPTIERVLGQAFEAVVTSGRRMRRRYHVLDPRWETSTRECRLHWEDYQNRWKQFEHIDLDSIENEDSKPEFFKWKLYRDAYRARQNVDPLA
jgi:RNA-directed DNA polymerase